MSTSERPRRRFDAGQRVQVRWKSGMIRDGYVRRAFSSGNYTVILDKPLSDGRRTYCEPHEVFKPAQNNFFGTDARPSAPSTRGRRQP